MPAYSRDSWFNELRSQGYSGALEDMLYSHLKTIGYGSSLPDLLFFIDSSFSSLDSYLYATEPILEIINLTFGGEVVTFGGESATW